MSAASEYQSRYAAAGAGDETVRLLRMTLRIEKLALAEEAFWAADFAHREAVTLYQQAIRERTLDMAKKHAVETAEQTLADATRIRNRAITDAIGSL